MCYASPMQTIISFFLAIKTFVTKLFRRKPVNKKPHVRVIYGPNFIAVADLDEAVRAAAPMTEKIRKFYHEHSEKRYPNDSNR